jgi:hypothetical protein
MITFPLASAAAATSSESISVERAWLLLLTAGLFYGLKLIRDLNQRIGSAPTSPSHLSTPALSPIATSSPVTPDVIAPEILAVISAAVHVTLAGQFRVIGVVPIAANEARTWSVEGRREVFRSHQLR